ncbi:MAG: hypothetical protein ACLSG8_05055 [Barnesiella sp.]
MSVSGLIENIASTLKSMPMTSRCKNLKPCKQSMKQCLLTIRQNHPTTKCGGMVETAISQCSEVIFRASRKPRYTPEEWRQSAPDGRRL